MTASELSLFSTVTYQSIEAVIIKIKDGGAILYSSANGWSSAYPIPASELTLVSRYTAPGGTPTSLATAPLYSKVYIGGKQGFIVDKTSILNQWTSNLEYFCTVWFHDTEEFLAYTEAQISFTATGGNGTKPPVEPPTQASAISFGTILKWGAIFGIGYYLLKGEGKPKQTAQYVD